MPDSQDYERTWLLPSRVAGSSPAGADAGEADNNALPLGTRIDEFEIINLVGIGGFGIVYLAHDHSLGRLVALKEYMPASLAARMEGLTVAVMSARLAETFHIGLRSFVNEARMLAQFDHRALVKVYRFWEANGTAYMVMPFYEGVTLKQTLQKMPQAPDEAWLRGIIDPLLEALQVLHDANCFHRDIAPDNILLLNDGRPLLLDFGAARRVISDRTQALTVILKPGYAPIEQYAELPHLKQGAWTDLYALAAVVYNAITGRPPLPSVGRTINDTLVPLAKVAAGRYSASFLQAMDRALAVKPEDRPQTIAEFRSLLEKKDVPEEKPVVVPVKPVAPLPAKGKSRRTELILAVAGALIVIIAGTLYALKSRTDSVSSSAATVQAGGTPSAAAVPVPPAATTRPAATVADSPATAEATVQTTDGKNLTSGQLADSWAPKPFNPVSILAQIYEQRDDKDGVTVVTESRVKINKDQLSFRVNSLKPGYLYLLMVDSAGKFILLFPNAIDTNNRIAGGSDLELPRPGSGLKALTAGGPAGRDYFLAIVSENRRDFSSAGIKKGDPFDEFPLKVAEKIARSADTSNPFAGKPLCPAGGKCSASYGAAFFSIEEVE